MSKRTWIRSSLLMLTVVTVGIVPGFPQNSAVKINPTLSEEQKIQKQIDSKTIQNTLEFEKDDAAKRKIIMGRTFNRPGKPIELFFYDDNAANVNYINLEKRNIESVVSKRSFNKTVKENKYNTMDVNPSGLNEMLNANPDDASLTQYQGIGKNLKK